MAEIAGRRLRPLSYNPPPEEVDALIERASHHRLGTDFLVDGALDAVSAEFGVHAFTVEGARQRLSRRLRTEN